MWGISSWAACARHTRTLYKRNEYPEGMDTGSMGRYGASGLRVKAASSPTEGMDTGTIGAVWGLGAAYWALFCESQNARWVGGSCSMA